MDNYQCLAYSSVALYELQKEGKEITVQNLRARMEYLMDVYSESAIEKKHEKLSREI